MSERSQAQPMPTEFVDPDKHPVLVTTTTTYTSGLTGKVLKTSRNQQLHLGALYREVRESLQRQHEEQMNKDNGTSESE